jgi:hypothetical protein
MLGKGWYMDMGWGAGGHPVGQAPGPWAADGSRRNIGVLKFDTPEHATRAAEAGEVRAVYDGMPAPKCRRAMLHLASGCQEGGHVQPMRRSLSAQHGVFAFEFR